MHEYERLVVIKVYLRCRDTFRQYESQIPLVLALRCRKLPASNGRIQLKRAIMSWAVCIYP